MDSHFPLLLEAQGHASFVWTASLLPVPVSSAVVGVFWSEFMLGHDFIASVAWTFLSASPLD